MKNRKDFNKKGCSTLNTINIFTEFYLRNVHDGIILPYDEDVISYLASHTNKNNKLGNYMMSDYLDAINNSIQSVEDCSLAYARLIALGLKKPYTIHTVRMNLAMFENGTNKGINYSWVETEDGIYDPIFRGIWPKKLWEKSFHPDMRKALDPETEEEILKVIKEDTVPTPNRYEKPLLSLGTSPRHQKEYFASSEEDIEYYDFQRTMFNEWQLLREKDNSLPQAVSQELVTHPVCQCIYRDCNNLSDSHLACFHLLEFVASDYEQYQKNKSYIERHYSGYAPITYNSLLKSYLGTDNFDPIVGDVVTSALLESIIDINNKSDKRNPSFN